MGPTYQSAQPLIDEDTRILGATYGEVLLSNPSHDIYAIKAKDVPGESWWRDTHGKPSKLRGQWNYKFESTASYGGTIF